MSERNWSSDSLFLERCPLCQSGFREKFLEHWDQKFLCLLWRCRNCGFVYLDPIPSNRQIVEWQDEDHFYDNESPGTERLSSILRSIENLQAPPGKLLEIGCNKGDLLVVAEQRGWEVSGVELSLTASRKAQAKLGERVFHGELANAPFEQRTYDLIVLWHVLEHLPEPQHFLQLARDYLRPGGLLALQVPGLHALDALLENGRIEELVCPAHLSYFESSTLKRAVEDAGFMIEWQDADSQRGFLTTFARKNQGTKMTNERTRSMTYATRDASRYWWYRQSYATYVPTPLALLRDEEWALLDEWYTETERLELIGECGIPAISLLEGFIVGGRTSRIVQLGHFAGFSVLLLGFIMRRLGRPQSLFSIDIDPRVSEFTSHWIARADLDEYVRIKVADSRDGTMPSEAAAWLGGPPELVFIDSSHQYSHTLEELDLWYEPLAPGGILMLHDTSRFAQQFDLSNAGGVYRAVKEWQNAKGVMALELNCEFSADRPAEDLIYGDPCGLAIIQKPFGVPA